MKRGFVDSSKKTLRNESPTYIALALDIHLLKVKVKQHACNLWHPQLYQSWLKAGVLSKVQLAMDIYLVQPRKVAKTLHVPKIK